MDIQLLEVANKALSDALDRAEKAKEECVYWAGIIAGAAAGTVAKLEDELQTPRRKGKLSKRRDEEMLALNAAAHKVFNKVIPNYPGVTGSKVMAGSRERDVVAARRECIVELRKACPGASLVSLGKFFGIDHSSIIYHLRSNEGEPLQ